MNAIVKKALIYVVTALVGSGVTLVVTEGLSINCKPVMSADSALKGLK